MHQMTGSVAARYRELKAAEPGLRARDAAERLGVSEGELVAARADGGEVRRLSLRAGDFAPLIHGFPGVGPVMADWRALVTAACAAPAAS